MIMKRKARALALRAVGLAFCAAPVPKCSFFSASKSSAPAAAGMVHGSKARLSLWGIASAGGETSRWSRIPLGDGAGFVTGALAKASITFLSTVTKSGW